MQVPSVEVVEGVHVTLQAVADEADEATPPRVVAVVAVAQLVVVVVVAVLSLTKDVAKEARVVAADVLSADFRSVSLV